MFYVYILRSQKDKELYVGFTEDLQRRMKEHARGNVSSTRQRRPLDLLCYEAYHYKEEAQSREVYLKSSDGKKDLRKRLTKSLMEGC